MPLSDKTDCDVEQIIFLGLLMDSHDETLSITEKRKKAILNMLNAWWVDSEFKTNELYSLTRTLSK